MKIKTAMTFSLFVVLIATALIVPSSFSTIPEPKQKLATEIPIDPSEASVDEGHQINNYKFSETALEYLVNKPIDPSMNKTIIDSNSKGSTDYSERETTNVLPDLNGTANKVLFTNESIISFSKPKNAEASDSDAVNSNANDGYFVIDSWDPDRPPAEPLPPTKN